MAGGGKILCGIIFMVAFVITLLVVTIPLIWTGAAVVGIYLIGKGILEMARGSKPKRYKCKRCDFTGTPEDILRHALKEHEAQLTSEERTKISALLKPEPAVQEPVEQPAEAAVR